MEFKKAFEKMKEGAKIKLPSWGGYWYWDTDKETIIMHTKNGEELDIRATKMVEYTALNICSDEWQLADEKNCPQLARKGWNGKKQYIELAKNISYLTPDGEKHNCNHNAIGNQAIAFVGTSGVQMGWLASQADMLAEDWVFAKSLKGDVE